jgi:hypothetical protein
MVNWGMFKGVTLFLESLKSKNIGDEKIFNCFNYLTLTLMGLMLKFDYKIQ